MRFPAIPTHRYLFVLLCLALSACGGGSGGGTGPEVTGPVPVTVLLPLGHGLTAGEITVAPGQSMEHGNVVVSCPTGGQNCVLNVAADGSASYDGTRGEPLIMSALATQALPPGHGLTAGEKITVAPGQSVEHGDVVVSCPAGGQSCVLNVAADGSASYERTGGMPSIMPALATQALPPGHGLTTGEVTVAPGQSMEHGNVVVSCPAGGQSCVLNVAADGSASYERTGGMPSIMAALATQALPPGHGLTTGEVTVAPGQSMEHGNVVVSCPAGGQSCVLNVAADGSASYERTGGMPSIMAALATQALPPGHGLTTGEITVAPGQSMEHGNVVVSCPAGGQSCVLNVAADGSASYDRTGGMPTLRILPLVAGPGQNPSDANPVLAQDEEDTLTATLANTDNSFPALAANVTRQFGATRSTALSTSFLVNNIRRDTTGAYVVDYTLDGTDGEVTLHMNDCTAATCSVAVDGRTFSFWSWTTDDDAPTVFDGLGEFDYLASLELTLQSPADTRRRTWFVFGVRTADLPSGSATYHGRFRARSHLTDNPSNNERQNYAGTMRLVANFDMRELEGRIIGVYGSEPGQSRRNLWPTSAFTITDGRIVNGQFTATLTGVDTDPNTPLAESVRGFIGHLLGEFYGPNAEEVGGVVTATRDVVGTADDQVLYGFIGGRKNDRLTGITDLEALWTAVDTDFQAGSITPLTAVKRPTVESTADGYTITYIVDGQTQTLELRESDFGSNTRYEKRTDGLDYIFWDETRSFERTRRFLSRFRPEHFDVNTLVIIHRDASDNITSSTLGNLIHGNRTTDTPTTGTASYDGGVLIREWPTDQAVFNRSRSVTGYRGDLNLSADFGSSTVTGNTTMLQSRPGDRSTSWVNASGGLSFNATISGNGLSATNLSGSGDLAGYSGGRVNGAFYGPGAAEVAGVLDATHGTQNKALSGYFGGQKQ